MKIFLSTPIAGFSSEQEYENYRNRMLLYYESFSKKWGYDNVFAAFVEASDFSSYETPAKSARKDMDKIKYCDVFVLFYPQKTPTSALVELGVAFALNKKIIMMSPHIDTLPYMVQGLPFAYPDQIKWLSNTDVETVIAEIDSLLKR